MADKRLTPAERRALHRRHNAAIRLLKTDPTIDRYSLLAAVVCPAPGSPLAQLGEQPGLPDPDADGLCDEPGCEWTAPARARKRGQLLARHREAVHG